MLLSSIQDMIESKVMAEPRWPRCAACRVDLVERKDPRTGKVVREGSRAMLECPVCHDVSIGPAPKAARRRFRVVQALVLASGAAAIISTLAARSLQLRTGFDFVFVLVVILVGGTAAALHLMLDAAARAMSPNNSA